MPTQITTTGAERRRDALRAVMSDARRDDDEDDADDDARAARVHAGIARGNTMRRALTLRRPGADAASVDEDETDDDDDDDDANAGVYFFTPSRRKRARIARESARETRCDRARAGGDVAFSSSSLFFARAKGAAVWILKFHSIRVGRSLVSYLLVDLFRCPIQQNAR